MISEKKVIVPQSMSANRNIDEKESVIMADIVYCYNDEVYFNLTNKCPCNCTILLQQQWEFGRRGKNFMV